MIQANELRIGNYVYYQFMESKRDVEICFNDFKILSVTGGRDYEPIPLTEQWLIDFGFERGLGWDDEQYYVIRFENTELFVYVNNDGYEADYNHNITTVHHLQNLCYFATGNELVKQKTTDKR